MARRRPAPEVQASERLDPGAHEVPVRLAVAQRATRPGAIASADVAPPAGRRLNTLLFFERNARGITWSTHSFPEVAAGRRAQRCASACAERDDDATAGASRSAVPG